jgi:hypothetical protein
VLKRGEREEKPEERRKGETDKGAVMVALNRFCCLLFFIFINISG